VHIIEKGAKMRTLQADDIFQLALKEINEQQVAVFVDADSSLEQREEAHDMIRALRKIDDYFDSVKTDEVMYNHKQTKGESAP
tara:strand:- start:150 stop:398 length:249 start_codon:yes stop_codon:yes gene_type:complete